MIFEPEKSDAYKDNDLLNNFWPPSKSVNI